MFRSVKAPSFLVKSIKHSFSVKHFKTSKPCTKMNKTSGSGYTLATSPHVYELAI